MDKSPTACRLTRALRKRLPELFEVFGVSSDRVLANFNIAHAPLLRVEAGALSECRMENAPFATQGAIKPAFSMLFVQFEGIGPSGTSNCLACDSSVRECQCQDAPLTNNNQHARLSSAP
jgi:hypothetical protein